MVKCKGVVSPAAMLFNSQPRAVMPHYTFDYGSLKANDAKGKRNKKFGMGVGYFPTVKTGGFPTRRSFDGKESAVTRNGKHS